MTGVDPAGPVSVQPNSVVSWGNGVTPSPPSTSGQHVVTTPAQSPAPAVSFDDLKGSHTQAGRLTEWLKLALDEPELLKTLGATANLGVLASGPAGVGKATMVRTVCAGRRLVELDGPEVGALRAEDRLGSVASAAETVRDGGGVLLITDIDALLPVTAEPVATLILTELRTAVATPGVAFVATSAVPESLDVRLRAPDLCDRELGLSLPDAAIRQAAPRGVAARCASQGPEPRRDRRAHPGIRGGRSVRAGARVPRCGPQPGRARTRNRRA